ncbi:transposase, partial [Escherichia coli]
TIRNKKQLVADSLVGTITTHQMELIRDCWEHIAFLEKSIASLEAKIESHLQPYHEEYELLQTIPGVSEATAASIIAEIGVDMNQFPSAEQLSSWAGVAPGNHESAGKKKVQRA